MTESFPDHTEPLEQFADFDVNKDIEQFRSEVRSSIDEVVKGQRETNLVYKTDSDSIQNKEIIAANKGRKAKVYLDNTIRLDEKDIHLYPLLLDEANKAISNPIDRVNDKTLVDVLDHEFDHRETTYSAEKAENCGAGIRLYIKDEKVLGFYPFATHTEGTALDHLRIASAPKELSSGDIVTITKMLYGEQKGLKGAYVATKTLLTNPGGLHWFVTELYPKLLDNFTKKYRLPRYF